MFLAQKSLLRPATHYTSTPVYLQDWFVEIGCRRSRSQQVTVARGGKIVGSMTIALQNNAFSMKQAYNLPWARVGGPLIASDVNPAMRAQIIRELIDQLPKNTSYFLTLSNEQDFNTFLEAGFSSDSEDNYIVYPNQKAVLESGFSKMTKRHLRKAEEQLSVATLDPDKFIGLYAEHLSMRRRKPYADLSIARDILVEAKLRGQGTIMTAFRRDTGDIDAAIACLWDDDNYYYWLTTRRPVVDGKPSVHQGAVKLLMYKAIGEAHAMGLNFDCDGVPSDYSDKKEGVSRLYSGMGAEKSVRYKVKRETSAERIASLVRIPVKRAIMKTVGTVVALKLNY
jgi:hypothetical protein